MEKIILKNTDYSFDASAQTVTFLSHTELVSKEYLLLITNTSTNDIIYNFGCDGYGGTINLNTFRLTLEYDTTAMSDSDSLQIILYSGESVLDTNAFLKQIRQQTQILEELRDLQYQTLKYIRKIYNPE